MHTLRGFPGGSAGKESACNAGDPGLILGSRRSPGGGHGNQLQCSCLKNPMDRGDWRALWDHKESDTTERLSTAEHGHTLSFGELYKIREIHCYIQELQFHTHKIKNYFLVKKLSHINQILIKS